LNDCPFLNFQPGLKSCAPHDGVVPPTRTSLVSVSPHSSAFLVLQ